MPREDIAHIDRVHQACRGYPIWQYGLSSLKERDAQMKFLRIANRHSVESSKIGRHFIKQSVLKIEVVK